MIGSVLSNGGMPAANSYPYWDMDRVWVRASISGGTYVFDPAFKVYEQTQGIDLISAMAYDRNGFLSAAGGSVGTDYIEDLNEAGLQNALNGYTLNLVDYIRTHYPNAPTESIIGGRSIIPEYLTELPTSLYFPASIQSVWTDIPDAYAHKIRIQHGQMDETINIADLAGQRLSITYGGDQGPLGSMAIPLEQQDMALRPTTQNAATLKSAPSAPAPAGQTLPDEKSTGPSLDGEGAATMETRSGTWDFGRISPSGYSEGTMELTNPNSVTIKLVISLSSNPSGAYAITSSGGTHNKSSFL